MKLSENIAKALAVTLELTGTNLSDPAAEVILADLSAYPEPQILAALKRCCRELKRGQFTLAAVLERVDDGRPAPEEAWAAVPKDEAASGFLTGEMREAYRTAWLLIQSGELIPARMAFLESYRKHLQQARDTRCPVRWEFTPGTDKDGRELVVLDAVEKGRLTADGARALLPYHREDEGLHARLIALSAGAFKRLEDKAA